VVRHVKEAVARGAKEIYLTGQDVITYGFDMRWRRGWTLPDLLERILREVDGEYRVRIGMSEPWVFEKSATSRKLWLEAQRRYTSRARTSSPTAST
jgi:threonylcarbamoyladenosine tRNA methylthiotransferase CDKAL1